MYVTTDLRTGGAEAMLTRVVTAEPRLADELIVVSLLPAEAYADRLRAADIGVVEFNFRRPLGAAADLIGLARLIAREQPDIVQGWMYHGDLAALLALVLSGRRRRTGLIWSIRCSTLDLSRYGRVLRLVVKACTLLSGRADMITANSGAGLKSHLALGYRPRRAEIVFNGIDLNEFKPDASARAAVRRQLGVGPDRIVVAHVARVDPMKDHATFLAAMAELPDLNAWAIGAGTEGLPDRPNVLRLGRRDDMAALLAAADFIVSSSAFGEGFSNAIAEGMACGVPAVATDVGDARDIIGDTGAVVPPRDPHALAAAIRALAEDTPAQRVARGALARQRIAERFSLERAVARFAALYETVLQSRGR
jgi:glycosyltransferase involved in cell wall biosynthesis